MFVILTGFIVLISVYVWWYYDYIKKQGSVKEIPGPTPVPLFGNAFHFSSSQTGKSRLFK